MIFLKNKMMNTLKKIFFNPLFYSFLFLILFFLCFRAFQSDKVYKKTLNKVSKNYVNNNVGIYPDDVPYTKFSNENYVKWDGAHFFFLKTNMYNVKKAGGEQVFAFFPLFPIIWKISFLPPVGILFLNFLMFSIGLFLLSGFDETKNKLLNFMLGLLLPGVVIFLMPYSEATFFLTISIAFWGLFRNKYWVYFVGMTLAATTRNASTVIVMALVCTEIFLFFEHRSIKKTLKSFVLKTTPLIVGLFIVSFIQLYYGSEIIFKFYSVLQDWEQHEFGIPHNLNDWSQESFSVHIGIISLVLIPILAYIIVNFWNSLKSSKSEIQESQNIKSETVNYLTILSGFYLLGVAAIVFFYQDSCLHGLMRYTICTPFFYLFLFCLFPKIKDMSWFTKTFVYFVLFLNGIFALGQLSYSSYWNFSDLGYFILGGIALLWLYQEYHKHLVYRLLFLGAAGLSLVWTSYLFNVYLSGGWIFT